ncbi:MAG: protein phosphatase CheZ [Gammaproteobacteria bacterium]|nr:protein phosphatase CheZ [Gammaproteobacteria bacterium]
MSADAGKIRTKCFPFILQIQVCLESVESVAFYKLLDEYLGAREKKLLKEVQALVCEVRDAMDDIRRFADALGKHDAGAEVSMDEFDNVAPDRLIEKAHRDVCAIRDNLLEVLIAQGYQDLTDYIIKGVLDVVNKLEYSLLTLAYISGFQIEQQLMPTIIGAGAATGAKNTFDEHGVGYSREDDN